MEAALRRYAQALWEFRGKASTRTRTRRCASPTASSLVLPAPRGARLPYATTIATLLATATNHPDYRIREEVVEQLSGPTLPR